MNELVIKNGIIVKGGTSQITNSLFVSRDVIAPSFTGSLYGTASWAINVVNGIPAPTATTSTQSIWATQSIFATQSIWSTNSLNATSAAWASSSVITNQAVFSSQSAFSTQSLTASYLVYALPYSIIAPSPANGITCSFSESNQRMELSVSATYNFTSSDHPAVGKVSDILLYISHSHANDSTVVFPTTWRNVEGSWPTTIRGASVATLWLRAFGPSDIIGGLHGSGSAATSGTSTSASWASSSLLANQALFSSQSVFATQSIWSTNSLNAVSAAWASSSVISNQALFASYSLWATQSLWSTNSLYAISASWVSGSALTTQALFSSQSLFATQSVWATNSLNAVSASWASSSVTTTQALFSSQSFWATNSLVANRSVFASQSMFATQSLWATSSITSSYSHTASFVAYSLSSSYFYLPGIGETRFATASSAAAGTSSLLTIATSSFDGCFINYVARGGPNRRAGSVASTWSSSLISHNEFSTVDLFGDQTGLYLNMVLAGSIAILQAENVSTNNYQIKMSVTSL